ncbi:MAG: hypothetical protein HUJ30_00825 [Gammaproteobacteria bacterium]|nr:hypothetical protein [Gammaproteobacteria bacterium]
MRVIKRLFVFSCLAFISFPFYAHALPEGVGSKILFTGMQRDRISVKSEAMSFTGLKRQTVPTGDNNKANNESNVKKTDR